MKIALVDSTPDARYYPVSLLKIGAWKRSEGHTCQLFNDVLPISNLFDEIWITTTFTYDVPHALGMVRESKRRAPVVKVGGVSASLLPKPFIDEGAEVHQGLVMEAEACAPDYTLLGNTPDYSITHTSRGCIRKCEFCMVSRLEPKFHNRDNWERDICTGASHVLFYDNNWLAKKISDLEHDVDVMRSLVSSGKVKSFDFNQSLDSRIMTEEKADLLKGIPIKPLRFAFDGMHEDKFFQNAVTMMAKRGFKEFMNLVLYNFDDTPKDLYYRLRECVRLSQELKIGCKACPMRYHPVLECDPNREYVGKYWTLKQRDGFKTLITAHANTGQISCTGAGDMTPIQEFEYWFGKDENEFVRLLSYPRIKEYSKRLKGNLRSVRAKNKV